MSQTDLEPLVQRRILVVDDEPVPRMAFRRALERVYQVSVAASAAEAATLLQQHDFDLVVTDLKMPGMNGIELIDQVRSFKPRQLFMAVSGNLYEYELDLGLREIPGLAKPFSLVDLLEAVSIRLEMADSFLASGESWTKQPSAAGGLDVAPATRDREAEGSG